MSTEPLVKFVEDMTLDELFSVAKIDNLALDPGIIQKAKDGDMDSQFKIAETYFNTSNNFNYSHAKAWCLKLSEKKYAKAQIMLGEIFFKDYILDEKEYTLKEAEKWFDKAYENDPGDAANEIGDFYLKNYNTEKALMWFLKAGEHGHADALYGAGNLLNLPDYEEYNPITADKYKALECYQKSADQGHERAILKVKEMNKQGYYSVAKLKGI